MPASAGGSAHFERALHAAERTRALRPFPHVQLSSSTTGVSVTERHPITRSAKIQEPPGDPDSTDIDHPSPGGGLSRRPSPGSVSTTTKRLYTGSEQALRALSLMHLVIGPIGRNHIIVMTTRQIIGNRTWMRLRTLCFAMTRPLGDILCLNRNNGRIKRHPLPPILAIRLFRWPKGELLRRTMADCRSAKLRPLLWGQWPVDVRPSLTSLDRESYRNLIYPLFIRISYGGG